MNDRQRKRALRLAKSLLPPEEFEKILSIEINDVGFGYDPFGMEKEAAVLAYAFARYIYKYWFRVESFGHQNIPLNGRALICPNHSGVIPVDAVMIGVDLIEKLEKARIMRAMVDNFMGFLPFVNTFFYRVGQVVGARRNFRDLLENDEIVTVFPEGSKGTGKHFSRRYNLLKFNVGFIELALTYRTPIIPAAVIGGEEQAPLLYNFKTIARVLGFPYFPVTPLFPLLGPAGFLPLPVKYYIYYGEPIHFYEDYPPEAVNDLETVRMLADKVQLSVQEMVNKGLEARPSVFGFGEG
jgi:1-acyl-sn-glycerol-3-phosphate acyltransferase